MQLLPDADRIFNQLSTLFGMVVDGSSACKVIDSTTNSEFIRLPKRIGIIKFRSCFYLTKAYVRALMLKTDNNLQDLIGGFIYRHQLSPKFIEIAQKWFIPLTETLRMHHDGAEGPFFVGVNGCQGSGKSTLSEFMVDYLTDVHGLNVITLSLDDFYFSKATRLALSIKIHPLLATRGVPGTHDVETLKETLIELKNQSYPLSIPRFNKATDNPFEQSQWLQVEKPVDIVIMEGWCWGVNAQPAGLLTDPINALEAQEDTTSAWRHYVNRQLKVAYEPLYNVIDYWIMLKAPDFSCVETWRCEQEHKLRTTLGVIDGDTSNHSGLMTDKQIRHFIQYYQRLTEFSLQTLPSRCDAVFELNETRNIVAARLSE